MIVITVTRDNKPEDHFLYWSFQKNKAIKKMIELCKDICGKEISKEVLEEAIIPVFVETTTSVECEFLSDHVSVCYFEKKDNDYDEKNKNKARNNPAVNSQKESPQGQVNSVQSM